MDCRWIRCEGNDRDAASLAAQRARRLKTVHLRHPQVHQDDVEGCRHGLGDGLAAVIRRFDRRSLTFQQLP